MGEFGEVVYLGCDGDVFPLCHVFVSEGGWSALVWLAGGSCKIGLGRIGLRAIWMLESLGPWIWAVERGRLRSHRFLYILGLSTVFGLEAGRRRKLYSRLMRACIHSEIMIASPETALFLPGLVFIHLLHVRDIFTLSEQV